LRQSMRLSIALLARRLHRIAVDKTTLHRAIGKQMQRVDELDYRIRDRWRAILDPRRRALEAATARLAQLDVRLGFARVRRRLEAGEASLMQGVKLRLSGARTAIGPLEAHLQQLSPLKILDRGYAIVERDGKIVKSPADAPVDSEIRVRLSQGALRGRVL